MVLKDCGDHAISGFPGETLCHHVDRFGGILCEYRGPVTSANELRYLLVGMPVTLRCNPGEAVYTPSDIRTVLVFEFNHRINN